MHLSCVSSASLGSCALRAGTNYLTSSVAHGLGGLLALTDGAEVWLSRADDGEPAGSGRLVVHAPVEGQVVSGLAWDGARARARARRGGGGVAWLAVVTNARDPRATAGALRVYSVRPAGDAVGDRVGAEAMGGDAWVVSTVYYADTDKYVKGVSWRPSWGQDDAGRRAFCWFTARQLTVCTLLLDDATSAEGAVRVETSVTPSVDIAGSSWGSMSLCCWAPPNSVLVGFEGELLVLEWPGCVQTGDDWSRYSTRKMLYVGSTLRSMHFISYAKDAGTSRWIGASDAPLQLVDEENATVTTVPGSRGTILSGPPSSAQEPSLMVEIGAGGGGRQNLFSIVRDGNGRVDDTIDGAARVATGTYNCVHDDEWENEHQDGEDDDGVIDLTGRIIGGGDTGSLGVGNVLGVLQDVASHGSALAGSALSDLFRVGAVDDVSLDRQGSMLSVITVSPKAITCHPGTSLPSLPSAALVAFDESSSLLAAVSPVTSVIELFRLDSETFGLTHQATHELPSAYRGRGLAFRKGVGNDRLLHALVAHKRPGGHVFEGLFPRLDVSLLTFSLDTEFAAGGAASSESAGRSDATTRVDDELWKRLQAAGVSTYGQALQEEALVHGQATRVDGDTDDDDGDDFKEEEAEEEAEEEEELEAVHAARGMQHGSEHGRSGLADLRQHLDDRLDKMETLLEYHTSQITTRLSVLENAVLALMQFRNKSKESCE